MDTLHAMELSVSEQTSQLESREILKDPKTIVVVTATLYPRWYRGRPREPLTEDKVRGDLALRTLLAAKQRGFQIALVDGGSSYEFLQALDKYNIPFEMQKEKGLQSLARRQALETAQSLLGVKVICQTEPEKISIISQCLNRASVPILKNEADIVVPKRTEASFATYPNYQARAEKKANKLYNQILRTHGLLDKDEPDIDFWFGVRVFANRPDVVELFTRQYQFRPAQIALHKIIQPEAYSNALFFPVVMALKAGFRVKTVEVPYRHPPEQTEFEKENLKFSRKRDIQRRTIITELIHFIRFLENSEKSRIRITRR